jgi:hypothetical protein
MKEETRKRMSRALDVDAMLKDRKKGLFIDLIYERMSAWLELAINPDLGAGAKAHFTGGVHFAKDLLTTLEEEATFPERQHEMVKKSVAERNDLISKTGDAEDGPPRAEYPTDAM